MLARFLAAVAILVATPGCFSTERSNPYDPDGTINPVVEVLQPFAITCRQWTENGTGLYPFAPGFSKDLLSGGEQQEVDDLCTGPCSISGCEDFVVLTSAVQSPVQRCTEALGVLDLRYLEVLYRQDSSLSIDLVLPDADDLRVEGAAEGGLFRIGPELFEWLDDDTAFFRYGTEYQTVHGGAQVTSRAWERFRSDVLLTRPLSSVDRNRMTITLSNGFGANRTACRVDLTFDQATEILSHPLAFAGGYGKHVAIADLPLDDSTFTSEVSRLEFGTTYASGDGVCWIDVVFRDAVTGTLVHAPPEGSQYGLEAMCDAAGDPPPLAVGRFLDADEEAFAVPFLDGSGQWVDFVGRDPDAEGFQIDVPDYFLFDAFAGVPVAMEGVGRFFGDSRDSLALLAPDGSSMALCAMSGTCVPVAPPLCVGATSRFVDVAGKPADIESTQVLAAVQSSNGSCVVWFDPGPPITVARQEEFTVSTPIAVHWASRGGAPSAIAVGYLDPADPASMVFEMPAAPAPQSRFFLVYDDDTCAPVLGAGSDGLASSAVSEPLLECADDGSGCDLYSYRSLGLPRVDIFHEEGFVVPDEGATAYYASGCADPADAYYLTGLPFLGDIVPTTVATGMAARLDVPRSRVVEETPSLCQVPSTVLLGAPAEGPLGGTGRMVVVYATGDQFRTQPACVPAGLP